MEKWIQYLIVGLMVLPSWAMGQVDGLPSLNNDDYNHQRYDRLFVEADQIYEQALADLRGAEEILEEANHHQNQMSDALRQAQRDVQTAKNRIVELRQKLKDLRRKKQTLEGRKLEVKAQLEQAQVAVQEQKALKERVEARLQNVRAKRNNIRDNELPPLKQALKAARKELKGVKDALTANQEALTANAQEFEELKAAIQAAKAKIADAKAAKQQAQQDKVAAQADRKAGQEAKATAEQAIEVLKAEIQSLKQQIAAAQQAGNQALVKELKVQLKAAKQARRAEVEMKNAAQAQIDAANTRIEEATAGVQNAQRELQAEKQHLDQLKVDRANNRTDRQNLIVINGEIEAQLPVAKQARDAAKALVDGKQVELQTAQAKVNKVKKRLENVTAEFQARKQARNALRDRLANIRSNIQANLEKMEKTRNQLQRNQRRKQEAEARVVHYDRELNQAISQTRQAQWERDAAQGVANGRWGDRQVALERRDKVRRNVREARNIMNQIAGDHAGSDANHGAEILGEAHGKPEGTSLGQRQGKTAGIREGKQRDYNQGYATGTEQGKEVGRQVAESDADKNGKKDGTALGKKQGLKKAYDDGMRDGLIEGETNGSDTVAYSRGRQNGEARGLAEAVEEAKAQEPIGYRDREQEYLNAPLNPVTVGNKKLASAFKGLQKGYTDEEAGRYYNPRPRSEYPSRVVAYYREFYDSIFRQTLSSSYEREYNRVHEHYRSRHYKIERDRYFAQDYPESREDGRLEAYNKFYRETYSAVYPGAYSERKEHYRQIAYDHYSDRKRGGKAQYKKGFDEGNAINSEKKGFREGRAHAYRTNIEPEKRKAYQKGVKRAEDLYNNNPIIHVVGAELVDADGDGIYRPGEMMYAKLVVKNFGLVAENSLKSKVRMKGSAVTVPQPMMNIPSIPGQSKATVFGIGQAMVKAEIQEGPEFQMTFDVMDGAQSIFQDRFRAQALYPAKVQVVGYEGVVIPGETTDLKFSFTNRSQKEQTLKIKLGYDSTKIDLDVAKRQLRLAAGETKSVVFQLRGRPEARFESSELELSVTQRGLVFAQPMNLEATIIRRHQPTQGSKGLIVSQDLSKGNGKHLYAMDRFDTWDLRVDGTLTAHALSNYKNKVVHLMVDSNLEMTGENMAQMKNFVDAGGDMVAWGAEMSRMSTMNHGLSSLLGIKAIRETHVNGMRINGVDSMAGTNLAVKGMIATMQPRDRRAISVMATSQGTHAVMMFTNGLGREKDMGRTLTIGVNVRGLEKSMVQGLLAQFEKVRMSFDNKINNARTQPKVFLPLVVYEARDELNAAEVDKNDGKWFKKKKRTKVYGSIMLGIYDQKKLRKDFATFYPMIADTVETMEDEGWNAGMVVAYSKFFGPSWQNLYCKRSGTSGTKYCRSESDDDNPW